MKITHSESTTGHPETNSAMNPQLLHPATQKTRMSACWEHRFTDHPTTWLEANSQIIQQAGINRRTYAGINCSSYLRHASIPQSIPTDEHGAAAQQTPRCRAFHTYHNSTYCLRKLCATNLEYGQMLLHQINADTVHF